MISEFIGGGFGAKQGAGVEALLAAELARAPVAPCGSRSPATRIRSSAAGGRGRADRHARRAPRRDAAGIELAAVVEMGAGGWIFPVAEPALSLYACENVRAMVFPVRTSLRAQNAFRAPGVVEGVTVLDQAMDELAARSTSIPSSCAGSNHVERDQGSGLPYSSKRLLACYDRAAELAGWAGRDGARASRRATGSCAGWAARRRSGGAAAGRRRTRRSASTARRALVTTGIQDIGTGTLTSARIVAAEELGLPLDRVASRGGDTGAEPLRAGRRGLDDDACRPPRGAERRRKVRRQLLSLAADVFEIGVDDLVVSDGRIRSRTAPSTPTSSRSPASSGTRRSTAPARAGRTPTGSA